MFLPKPMGGKSYGGINRRKRRPSNKRPAGRKKGSPSPYTENVGTRGNQWGQAGNNLPDKTFNGGRTTFIFQIRGWSFLGDYGEEPLSWGSRCSNVSGQERDRA